MVEGVRGDDFWRTRAREKPRFRSSAQSLVAQAVSRARKCVKGGQNGD
jgi:hypothetical protein